MSRPANPLRYFNASPEIIRLVVMMHVCFPLSLRNVEDLWFERGIDICHVTVRFWWNRFGPMLASEIRRQCVSRMRGFRHRRWHLDAPQASAVGCSRRSVCRNPPLIGQSGEA